MTAAGAVVEPAPVGAAGPAWWERALVAALALALIASRMRLVGVFGARWTDEDQALLWYAASELLDGRIHEPYFYGQPYGSWLEALLAVPAVVVGVPLRVALPAAAAVLGTVPWLVLAGVAWRRRRSGTAVALLALPVAMAVEGSILATMPRGLLPGIAIGVMVAALVLAWPRSSVAAAIFGFGLVIAASANVGSGLVTGPTAVWMGLTALVAGPAAWRRRVVPLGLGLVAGAGLHLAAQSFYRANPAHDVHGAPAFELSIERLTENLAELGRYLPVYAPEPWRHWSFLALVAVGVSVWAVVRTRSWIVAVAATTALALSVSVLGTAKANDGTASIFFPYARVLLALPWTVGVLAVLPAPAPTADAPGPEAGRRRGVVRPLALVLLAVAALGAGLVREVTLTSRLDDLLAEADGQPPVAPVATADLARRCASRHRIAAAEEVTVILDRYDRTASYGCDALLRSKVTTLFPEYDRRTWLLEEAERRSVDRLLVAGLDGCPTPPAEAGDSCRVVDADGAVHLVEGRARPIAEWARALGLPVRPT